VSVTDVGRQRIPEGWGSDSKGSVPRGAVLGLGDGGEKVGIGRSEVASGGVAMEEIFQV